MTTRTYRFDFMRWTASLAVIGIHSLGFIEEMWARQEKPIDFIWGHTLLRWAVPLFVMVSGAVLIGKSNAESATTFYYRRFSWFIPTLAFWVVAYSTLRLVTNSDQTVWDQTSAALTGRPFVHLWYLYLLPGLYLITPLFRSFIKDSSRQDQWLIFWGFTLLLSLDKGLSFLLPPSELSAWPFWFTAYIPSFFLGYLIIGARRISLPALASGFLFGFLLTGSLAKLGIGSGFFMNYFSPGVMLMSACAFGAIYQTSISPAWSSAMKRLIPPSLCSLSLGVYLIHPAFLSAMKRLPLEWPSMNPHISALAVFLAVAILSIVTAAVFKNIPWLKQVV